MIRKTFKVIKRVRYEDYRSKSHIERVMVETWWLFFIPIYTSEHLLDLNL